MAFYLQEISSHFTSTVDDNNKQPNRVSADLGKSRYKQFPTDDSIDSYIAIITTNSVHLHLVSKTIQIKSA